MALSIGIDFGTFTTRVIYNTKSDEGITNIISLSTNAFRKAMKYLF